MDSFLAFKPVNDELQHFAQNGAKHSVGKKVSFSPEAVESSEAIAILALRKNTSESFFTPIREQLYSLYSFKWNAQIIDLGDFNYTEQDIQNPEAFRFILQEINESFGQIIYLTEEKRSIFHQAVNAKPSFLDLSIIDKTISLEPNIEKLKDQNFLSKLIKENIDNIANVKCLGYQTYSTDPAHLELMDYLDMEAERLGEFIASIVEIEPYLRQSNLVCVNADSVQGFINHKGEIEPNGFNGREICAVSRFSGLSLITTMFSINQLSFKNIQSNAPLYAQILWYYLDGHHQRPAYLNLKSDNFETYFVENTNHRLVFYKQPMNIWWMQLKSFYNHELKNSEIIPASNTDYKVAMEGRIPSRLLNFHARNLT